MIPKIRGMNQNRERGFTIVELLVVILIMGVLAAITIPAFAVQRRNSVDSGVKADISNVAKQIETWMIRYPASPIPNFTVTSTGSTATAVSLRDAKAQNGTTITVAAVAGKPGNFRIVGKNSAGEKAAAPAGYIYDSSQNGFQL